jgi:RNA polymerase sigma-70 factor, ECF subfamily
VTASLWAQSEDGSLVAAILQGDDDAFTTLIDRYHPSLIRMATLFVRDRHIAEEVAQETWIGVLRGLDRFEGRSTFRTWLFGILANQAKRRGERERRIIPFSALSQLPDGDDPALPEERFRPPGADWAGWWATPPTAWEIAPEEAALSAEVRAELEQAIATLPPNQRAVLTLRDVEGWETREICNVLGLTPTNQRVLLHRARSRVRQELERSREPWER